MDNPRSSNYGKILFRLGAIMILLVLPGIVTGISRASRNEAPQVRLQYATFEPLQSEPFIPEGLRLSTQNGGSTTYLLQFDGPVLEGWKNRVRAAGVVLYDYIPDYAFIARLDSAALAEISSLPFVRWVGAYHPAYRLEASLRALRLEKPTGMLAVEIQLLPDAHLANFAQAAKALGGQINGLAPGHARVILPAEKIPQLAALDAVLWVEPYLAPRLLNDTAGGTIMGTDSVRSTLGLFGSGQIVAVADSGLDTGNPATLHPDVIGRVLQAYALGRTGDWSDYVSHGTHVVGSILGNGSVSGSNPGGHLYSGTYAGVAPEAQLVMQSVADSGGGLGGIPFNRGDLMRDAYDNDGARIHSNSWGSSTYGQYNLGAQQIDQAAWDRQDMLILFSAGNDGEDLNLDGLVDPDSIGSPGSAKNVLTVGASENNRPSINSIWGSSYGAPIASDRRADDPTGIAAFSSRGPTDDERVKPDVVAPGTFIASLRTRQYVFDDDLESGTGSYTDTMHLGGTGSSWQVLTDDPHSSSHYWKEVVNGSFTAGAITFLLTPPMDVRPTGGVFDVHFWHKYNLSSGDKLYVVVWNEDISDWNGYQLGETGSTSAYTYRRVTFSLSSLFGSTPSAVRIGFGIVSDGSSNSSWWLDDLRVDGADWGTLGGLGLATPGDALDEAYLMMGGTSMSTPLTSGAAALVREWLTTLRSFTNPSAALMKATILNGAADISPGQYTSPQEIPATRPNNVTGWGRVDLAGSLNPPAPEQIWLHDQTGGLSTGGSSTFHLTLGFTQTLALNAASAWPSISPSIQAAAETPAAAESRGSLGAAQRPVVLKADSQPDLQPAASDAAVSLAVDDGQPERLIGWGVENSDLAYQFIWLNRFTPSPTEYPFQLEEIWVMFANPISTTTQIQIGDAIQIAVYQDADGDPANGATLLGTVESTIQAVNGTTWSAYTLASPIQVNGPGDVLIGVIDRYVTDGVSPFSYPAAKDTTAPQNRSWIGAWNATPPDPPTPLPQPPSETFELVTPAGNWLIRGFGTTGGSPTPVPSPTPPPGSGGPFSVTLAWTDWPGSTVAAKALVNDLDLEVIDPNGTHYYGNSGLYSGGSSCLRSSLWDACNNVEGVSIAVPPYGSYTIIVHGTNIPNGPQPFALVASGDNLLGTAQRLYLPFLGR